MVTLVNRAKMTTSTTGTGTITLGSAVERYQSFADAGVVDGDEVRYTIEDGLSWEIGSGTYSSSGTTLTRTVDESSDGGTAISLSGNAVVFVTAAGDDLQNAADMDQGVSTTDSPEFAGLTVDTDTLYVDSVNNRVGVETSSPVSALDVTGTVTSDGLTVDGAVTVEGKIALGDELGNANLSNTLDFGSSVGVAGYRSINLIDTSAGVKISRLNDDGNGPFIDFQEWDSTITTLKTRAFIAVEGGDFIYRNLTTGGGDHIFQGESNAELMRIDSSGNVGIGTSSPSTALDVSGVASAETLRTGSRSAISVPDSEGSSRIPPLMISGNLFADTTPSVAFYNTTKNAGVFNFLRSNTTTVGDHALVSNNNNIGSLQWAASDGTNFIRAAQIEAVVDGTPATGDMPGALKFNTTSSGFAAPSERLRIDSLGSVFVAHTGGSGKNPGYSGFEGISLTDQAYLSAYRDGGTVCFWGRGTNGNLQTFRFNGTTTVGTITIDASSTSYNTSSDYRLKEDITPVPNPSDRVLALNPVNFAWKATGIRVDGFLAHEAQEVVPEAVTGEKDGEEMQAIDQSKLVPLLTAALQDALKRIEALEGYPE